MSSSFTSRAHAGRLLAARVEALFDADEKGKGKGKGVVASSGGGGGGRNGNGNGGTRFGGLQRRVFGLARGGLPVAWEVACRLKVRLLLRFMLHRFFYVTNNVTY
jgi:hypothetical protein